MIGKSTWESSNHIGADAADTGRRTIKGLGDSLKPTATLLIPIGAVLTPSAVVSGLS